MKKNKTSIKKAMLLIGTALLALTYPISILRAEDTDQQLEFNVNAEGRGLIIWGFSWMPHYPGESFYLGGPGPNPPAVPLPLFNWGSPEYSAKLTSSVIKVTGVSNLDEAPARTDSPESLPTDLTKFWLVNQNSSGVLRASWIERDSNVHNIDVNISGLKSGGVWVGPPATCPWGHFSLGFISPSVPVTPIIFNGELDGNPIEGMMHIITWPDTMMVNLWINDGADGTYVNFIWVNPDAYMTHEWLTYWLAFEIKLPEFGYGTNDDPLSAWVPTAEIFTRDLKVGDKVTLQSNARYWSDDFSDKDFNGWTITGYNFEPFFVDMMTPPLPIKGNYTAEDGILLSLGPRVANHASVASHPSTTAYGTWSFDLYITDETEEHFYVYFITDDWGDYPVHINSYDIAIVLEPGQAWSQALEEDAQGGFVLIKRNGAAIEGGWQPLGSYSVYEDLSGVYQIDITRDYLGNFKVYIDGELGIEARDNEHKTSTWFRFTGEPGPAIDNIVVKDSIDRLALNLDEKNMGLQTEIQDIEEEKIELENEILDMEEEKTELENEKSILINEKNTLEGTVSTLENQVSRLEDSIGSSQIYMIIALLVGLGVGALAMYFRYR